MVSQNCYSLWYVGCFFPFLCLPHFYYDFVEIAQLSWFFKQGLAKVESLVQSGKVRDTVEILRNGQVQQGHHRLANAIKHKRTIDVIIKWFLGEWLIW